MTAKNLVQLLINLSFKHRFDRFILFKAPLAKLVIHYLEVSFYSPHTNIVGVSCFMTRVNKNHIEEIMKKKPKWYCQLAA